MYNILENLVFKDFRKEKVSGLFFRVVRSTYESSISFWDKNVDCWEKV
jgi:hypothetical protein